MDLTTYDDIYVTFLTNCPTEDINLPNDDIKIYEAIRNAVRLYNNRMRTSFACDDETETVNATFNDDELLTVAHYLRQSFLEGQLTYFTTLWQPYSKELGLRNYQSQVKSFEFLIQKQEEKIDELIRNTEVDFM